jgi:hypothetical protein
MKTRTGEIVAFIDNRSEAASILEFAGLLAEENGARLISVFIQPALALTPPESFARGTGIQDVIKTHQSQLESIEGASGLNSRTLCDVTQSRGRNGDHCLTGAPRWPCLRTTQTSWLLPAQSAAKCPTFRASRNPWC